MSINKTKKGSGEVDKLQEEFDEIRQNIEGLSSNEKSSADKSFIIGRNLIKLHSENHYRQLTDEDGNCFKKWQDFCEKGCGFSRTYADKLMKCAKMQERLEASRVTTIKQSVANLYRLHVAEEKHSIDIETVWKEATKSTPDAFPTRSEVSKAINPPAQSRNTTSPGKKFFDGLSKLNLTANEKKILAAIIAKWEAAHKKTAEAAEA